MYVFERGSYDEDMGIWVRDDSDEKESPFSDLYNCIYFTVVTMTTLGYGDIFPKTYTGKVIALIAACAGICNLTFLINIIGECFEEMFREFVREKSRKADEELTLYIDKHIFRASNQIKAKQGRSIDRVLRSVSTRSSRMSYLSSQDGSRDVTIRRINIPTPLESVTSKGTMSSVY
jgi:hypothetical protein